jgi:hypothetical protein
MQCKVLSVWPSERLDFVEEMRAVDVRPHGQGSMYHPMVLIRNYLWRWAQR